MKWILCIVAFHLLTSELTAQSDGVGRRLTYHDGVRKNAVYVEFGGVGTFWSLLNYDRVIPISDQLAFVPRVGVGYVGSVYPLYELNLMTGNYHNLELGFGQSLFLNTFPERDFMIRFGYRYQGPRGLLIRAAPFYYQVYWPDQNKNDHKIWLGLSVGYCF